VSSPPAPIILATTSNIVIKDAKKKAKTSTHPWRKRITYPIHPLDPSVTPNVGVNATMSIIVMSRTPEKMVW
jgi:hypothetical protein